MILKPGPLISEGSGKVGGVVMARNRGGLYLRAWANPLNPNSPLQQEVRAGMAYIMSIWNSALMATHRDEWELYAANTPMLNRLGDTIYLTGQQHFARSMVSCYQAALAGSGVVVVTDGPTTFGLPVAPASLVPTLSEASGLSLAYDDSQDWCDLDNSVMLVYQGRPRNPSRNYFRGPWRLAGYVDGDSVAPPSTPLVVSAANLPYTITEGQRVSLYARIRHADGRMSSKIICDGIVGA